MTVGAYSSSTEDTETSTGLPARRVAKRRIIDETKLNPEEAERLENRRAYNRECAAKARKRSKDLISQLQEQVEQLTKDKNGLERANEVMKAQLQLLEQQNRTLMLNQRSNNNGNNTRSNNSSGNTNVNSLPIVATLQGNHAGLLAGLSNGTQLGMGIPSVAVLDALSAQGHLSVGSGPQAGNVSILTSNGGQQAGNVSILTSNAGQQASFVVGQSNLGGLIAGSTAGQNGGAPGLVASGGQQGNIALGISSLQGENPGRLVTLGNSTVANDQTKYHVLRTL